MRSVNIFEVSLTTNFQIKSRSIYRIVSVSNLITVGLLQPLIIDWLSHLHIEGNNNRNPPTFLFVFFFCPFRSTLFHISNLSIQYTKLFSKFVNKGPVGRILRNYHNWKYIFKNIQCYLRRLLALMKRLNI